MLNLSVRASPVKFSELLNLISIIYFQKRGTTMITAVLSWASAIISLAKMLNPDNKNYDESKKVIDKLGSVAGIVSTSSAAKSAQRAIINPMVVVERPLLHQEYMNELLTIIQLRDIMNVLTHLSLQGEVGGVKIAKLIEGINPSRSGFLSLMGAESFGGTNILPPVAGTEADLVTVKDKDGVMIDTKLQNTLNEYSPLALGKVVGAEVIIDGKRNTFPLVFRQVPVPADTKQLENVFQVAKPEDGLRMRIMMLKTGEITPAEFLTGSDLVKKEFAVRKNDLTGYYEEAQKRATRNRAEAIRTGEASMNTMANVFVMSSDTARQIELEIGLRFANASSRDRIFSKTVANTIVVVNEGRGIFTFYTHGQDMPEVYTRSEIKVKAAKDTSSNSLQDLLKLFNGGV
ncbi:putative capsid and scaffold protein [Klebsiella phage KPN8]|nr:putative capsid and scaffold protein [Klebsiella phage KPN8]